MKKVLAVISLLVSFHIAATDNLTKALHHELGRQPIRSVNVTKDTHPVLCTLVQELVDVANIQMPEYITLFSAASSVHRTNRESLRIVKDMNPSVGLLGDIYLCHEILLNLTYEEIKGVIALAIAEKAINRHLKVFLGASGILITWITLLYMVSKESKKIDFAPGFNKFDMVSKENKMIDWFHTFVGNIIIKGVDPLFRRLFGRLFETFDLPYQYRSWSSENSLFVFGVFSPCFLSAKFIADNLQKRVDMHAASLTSYDSVTGAISAMDRVKELYIQESFISRVATKLHIKGIWNTLTYPIRSYTSEERIDYLRNEAKLEACA